MRPLTPIIAALCLCSAAGEDDRTAAGSLESYATMHCIGYDWPITGDENHNATCEVDYRREGENAWRKALPLLRLHTDRVNGLAGSLFNLEAGTSYEVRLQLRDADGGGETTIRRERTRPLPMPPRDGRTLHVVPGAGGGDGTAESPYRGIATADAAARPGDTLIVRSGKYGVVRFGTGGDDDRRVCWKGGKDAILAGASIAASHLWVEGFTFRCEEETQAIKAEPSRQDVVLFRNRFVGFHDTIKLSRGSREWVIIDNEIEGANDPIDGGLTGEGIELGKGRGHVVAHNRISKTADGVSYPGSDCDIYGNEIIDVSDDAVETDMGQQNIRVWGNRITNACNNVFSWQPMNRGPWYFVRNQVVITRGKIYKFNIVNDRFVMLHNTFVFPKVASEFAQGLLNSFCRNNLYIATGDESPIFRAAWNKRKPGGPGRGFVPDWMSDVDYDGFDWGGMTEPFHWNGKVCKDLESFAAEVGIERHAIRVSREEIFERWTVPSGEAGTKPPLLSLRKGSAAADAGSLLPNINEDFSGKAPDLGALEHGKPAPVYGPRP